MTAAAALARVEAAGLRLHLAHDGRVQMQADAPPHPDVLADLRRWREDVARIMVARHRQATSAPPAPPILSDADIYLTGFAVRLDAVLRDGATVARCPSGALDVTLPDGRLWLLSPALVARMAAAGLLPAKLAETRR